MTSGGSSAGSGASVAAGVAPFAIGSDGGGSVRIPSALCGLYGIKASMGRVALYPGCRDERYPGVSSWESLEHIGPMSRTVADSALMLKRHHRTRPARPLFHSGRRLRLRRGHQGRASRACASPTARTGATPPVDPEVRRVVSEAVARVRDRSRLHGRARQSGLGRSVSATFWTLVAGDTDLTGMRRMMKGREQEMSPHLVDLLQRPWTAEDFTDAKIDPADGLQPHVAVHGQLRPAADADARGAGVPGPHAGARDHRRQAWSRPATGCASPSPAT